MEPLQDSQWGQPCAPAALAQMKFIFSVLRENDTAKKKDPTAGTEEGMALTPLNHNKLLDYLAVS